jgi:hypothetical protein
MTSATFPNIKPLLTGVTAKFLHGGVRFTFAGVAPRLKKTENFVIFT